MGLWILAGLAGALVALVVVVVIVGHRLPDTYTAYGTVELDLSPAELWAELADFEKHPRGAKMVRGVERLPDVDGRPSWTENLGSSVVTWTAVEWDPPRRMVCEARDSTVPMTARWVTEIAPREGGSRLLLENETHIRSGTWHVPIFRVIMTLTSGARRGMTDYLRSVAPGFEPGAVAWKAQG